jgi:enamine deaminase RidA (YjgF/YER057c/UK114 family)
MARITERDGARFVSTGSAWESANGYSRAVVVGDRVWFSGTTAAMPDGSICAPGDGAAQTTRCFEIVQGALAALGLDRSCIVRSRVYTTDVSQHEAIGSAHKAFFGEHRPCLTLVGTSGLVHPDLVVEVECEGVIVDR